MLLSFVNIDKRSEAVSIRFDLITPLSELQKKNHRHYTYADISQMSGLTRQGVRRLLTQETRQIDVDTISKLHNFFESQGMPLATGDLFAKVVNN